MKVLLLLLALSFSQWMFSQIFDCTEFIWVEDSIRNSIGRIQNENSAEKKFVLSDSLKTFLISVLENKDSYYYDFNNSNLEIALSTDGSLRSFSWAIEEEPFKFIYFAVFQFFNPQNSETKVFVLTDNNILNNDICNKNSWYGALYYDIIEKDVFGKPNYFLLGFDYNNAFSKKKIIDVLYKDDSGEILLGKPLFYRDNKAYNRIIFEYSRHVSMSLVYSNEQKSIIFDRLSPIEPKYEGMFEYYGPDFGVNSFVFKRGRWIEIEDIDIRNTP